jgi:hypothetical protein
MLSSQASPGGGGKNQLYEFKIARLSFSSCVETTIRPGQIYSAAAAAGKMKEEEDGKRRRNMEIMKITWEREEAAKNDDRGTGQFACRVSKQSRFN